MITKIKNFLGIGKREKYVKEHMDFANLRSCVFMSSVVAVLECWMIFNLIREILLPERDRSSAWIISHAAFYIALLAVALVLLVYALRVLKTGKNNHFITRLLCWCFALVSVAFGIFISAFDYMKHEQVFAFVSMMIFAFGLLVWKPWAILALTTGSFVAMYLVMHYIDGASYATRINFFVMWICVTMAALTNHYQWIREAQKDEALEVMNNGLRQMLTTDALTGLRSRNGLEEDAPYFFGKELILMVTDVDNFKYINDSYGHETGDGVLKRMTELLRETFLVGMEAPKEQPHIHAYRFGGDEFIIIAEEWDRTDFEKAVRVWQERVYRIGFKDSGVRVLTSCGYVIGQVEDKEGLWNMIRYADRKVYEAKHLGRVQILGDLAEAVAEQEQTSSKRLMTETEIDPLTGLPNTLYFREQADRLLADPTVNTDELAFYFLDIQNFKTFNEKYGYKEGDELLRKFSRKLEEIFEGALIARASDDHFVILSYEDGCRQKMGRLRTALHEMSQGVTLELKVGVYMPDIDERDSAVAGYRSRMACTKAKESAQDNYAFYDHELEESLRKKQYILSHLTEALEQEWIQVYYQPIVWLETGKVCGLEALARWRDPEYGMISPADFIGVLEDARLIYKLDQYIVRKVCMEFSTHRSGGSIVVPVSLNFSRLDFELCDMVSYLEETAAEFDIPRDYLEVEITETALTDYPEFLEDAMRRFRERGFRLWLDDFGSGYSSLNVLKDFEFDVLKIDMKFLSDFSNNEKSRPILNNVVNLANDISILPLTEGVETGEQAAFLKEIGCKRAQGYYYGRPMEYERIVERFQNGELALSDELELI